MTLRMADICVRLALGHQILENKSFTPANSFRTLFWGMKNGGFMKVILLLSCIISTMACAIPAQVIVIRHAEKPDEESSHLSEKGQQRAAALAIAFQSQNELTKFGTPVALLAARNRHEDSSQRASETLAPSSQALH